MRKIRYFHLMSDEKTVREIDWERWRKICKTDYDAKQTRLILRTYGDSEFYARKGKCFIYIPRAQLDEVLKRCREKDV